MKTITAHVPDQLHSAIAEYAKRTGRTEDDVVCEALTRLPLSHEPKPAAHSLRDFKPLGLKPFSRDALRSDDILDEMINDDRN